MKQKEQPLNYKEKPIRPKKKQKIQAKLEAAEKRAAEAAAALNAANTAAADEKAGRSEAERTAAELQGKANKAEEETKKIQAKLEAAQQQAAATRTELQRQLDAAKAAAQEDAQRAGEQQAKAVQTLSSMEDLIRDAILKQKTITSFNYWMDECCSLDLLEYKNEKNKQTDELTALKEKKELEIQEVKEQIKSQEAELNTIMSDSGIQAAIAKQQAVERDQQIMQEKQKELLVHKNQHSTIEREYQRLEVIINRRETENQKINQAKQSIQQAKSELDTYSQLKQLLRPEDPDQDITNPNLYPTTPDTVNNLVSTIDKLTTQCST